MEVYSDGGLDWKGVHITSEEYEHLKSMVCGIARKYTGYAYIEYDDLEQELWIKALGLIAYHGNVNLKLIASSLYNNAIDLVRKRKRKHDNEKHLDSNTFNFLDDNESNAKVNYLVSQNDLSDYSTSVVSELVELFDEGSKARAYVTMVAEFTGALSGEDYLDSVKEKFTDFRPEKEFAIALGFKDDTSTGYRSLRQNVREVVKWYLEDAYKIK